MLPMSKGSSKTSDDAGAKAALGMRRLIAQLLGGVALVVAAMLVANHTGLMDSLGLDFKGEQAVGRAEMDPNGRCILRFEDPTGAIRRKQYDGGFGFQRLNNGVTEIRVVYDPSDPDSFQPAGLSYVPGVVTAILFLSGDDLGATGTPYCQVDEAPAWTRTNCCVKK